MDDSSPDHQDADAGADVAAQPDRTDRSSAWRVVRQGLIGGFVATAVMTLYRLPVFRALPPTAEFWAMYVGRGEAESYLPESILLHFAYGSGGGVMFSLLYALAVNRTDVDRRWIGLGGGLVFAGALSLFGSRVIFPKLLHERLDDEEALVFHLGHLVYGLTLGTWLTTRKGFGDVYE